MSWNRQKYNHKYSRSREKSLLDYFYNTHDEGWDDQDYEFWLWDRESDLSFESYYYPIKNMDDLARCKVLTLLRSLDLAGDEELYKLGWY